MKRGTVVKQVILCSIPLFSMLGCKGGQILEGVKTVNVYSSNSGTPVLKGTIDLRFFKEYNNIPYIAIDTFLNAFKTNVYSINVNNDKFTFTNKIWANDTRRTYKPNAVFDISNNSITYDDYTCFVCDDTTAINPLDLYNGKYQIYYGYYSLVEENYTAGDSLTIDLDDYSIKTCYTDGKLYFPLYTAKCLFTIQTTSYFFNGNALYIDAAQQDCEFNRAVRNNLFTPSTTYLEYAYNQFALDIDLHFGMRNFSRKLRSNSSQEYKYMGGTGGNAYSVLNQYKNNFVSSVLNFDSATHDFYKNYLDDGGHTGLFSRSYYNPVGTGVTYGNEIKYSSKINSNMSYSRQYNGIDLSEGYLRYINNSENNITRFFTFDTFDEYAENAFFYFVRSINDGKTKHVVIDLSKNGGGLVVVAEELINYLTKGRASNHILSSVNNSKGYIKFNSDNNYDYTIDSNDYLPNTVETVDIITSGCSFSAANYTACMVAKYGDDNYTKIYIDGENSGGGVCAVEGSMMNAIGMTSQWSSMYRLCEEKNNGDWIGVDDGVTSMNKENGQEVTINGEAWNSLNTSQRLNYSNYKALNTKILAR